MDLIATLLNGLWDAPRLVVSTLLGIAIGLGLYYLTGQEPASAALAAGCALFGFLLGVLLHATRRRVPRRDAD